MTPEQIEVAARKLCELREWEITEVNLAHARSTLQLHLARPAVQAIKYALEQK